MLYRRSKRRNDLRSLCRLARVQCCHVQLVLQIYIRLPQLFDFLITHLVQYGLCLLLDCQPRQVSFILYNSLCLERCGFVVTAALCQLSLDTVETLHH